MEEFKNTIENTIKTDDQLLDQENANRFDMALDESYVESVGEVIEFTLKNSLKEKNLQQFTELPINVNNVLPRRIEKSKFFIKDSHNWLGEVIEINEEENEFSAKLIDTTDKDTNTYEVAEFSFDDISSGDKDLFQLGALFYWNVGRFVNNGTVKKQSNIIFKRSTSLDPDDFDVILNYADQLSEIEWE